MRAIRLAVAATALASPLRPPPRRRRGPESLAAAAILNNMAEVNVRQGRYAEAERLTLQRAMLALIAAGGPTAHPANWAPFVVVGEGRALGASKVSDHSGLISCFQPPNAAISGALSYKSGPPVLGS